MLILSLLLFSSILHFSYSAELQTSSIPEFDPTICVKKTSVHCLVPEACANSVELESYTNVKEFRACDVQLVARIYNKERIHFEIFALNTDSVVLRDSNGKTIFDCKIADGVAKAESERGVIDDDTVFGFRNDKRFYCAFIVHSSTEIFPYPDLNESKKGNWLVAGSTYTISNIAISTHLQKTCDYTSIDDDFPARSGYTVEKIPVTNLFAESISCPENSTLIYRDTRGTQFEAEQFSCLKVSMDKYFFQINKLDGSFILMNGQFSAGCERQNCLMCSSPAFQCKEANCSTPTQEKTEDGCVQWKCPHSFITFNDDLLPSRGNISCVGKKWQMNEVEVKSAICPAQIPCHSIRQLKCFEDQACSQLKRLKQTTVTCKDGMDMRILSGDGETAIERISCDSEKGKYMILKGEGAVELPEDAVIRCLDYSSAAFTGSTVVYAGVSATLLLVMAIVVIILVYRRRKNRAEPNQSTVKKESEKVERSNP